MCVTLRRSGYATVYNLYFDKHPDEMLHYYATQSALYMYTKYSGISTFSSSCLDSDQAQRFVRLDLVSKCLQRLSVDLWMT